MEEPRGEHQPTASDNFRSMVSRLREARRQPGYWYRREARAAALVHAMAVLNSPESERRRLTEEVRFLIEVFPVDAILALKTLREAGAIEKVALRRFLGLPPRGRIFPQSPKQIC